MRPLYKIFNPEIGTIVHHFIHDETQGQIDAFLECLSFPRGQWEMLSADATSEEAASFQEQHEDLRPLPQLKLRVVK